MRSSAATSSTRISCRSGSRTGTPTAQRAVVEHLDRYLSLAEFAELPHPGDYRTLERMAAAAVHIFDATTFDLANRLPEATLERLLRLLRVSRGQCPQLLRLMAAMVRVDSTVVPIERHQTVIVRSLDYFRAELAPALTLKALTAAACFDRRAAGAGADDDDDRLPQSVLALVSLLATCCEGDGRNANRAICAQLIPLQTLVRVLEAPHAPLLRRLPFLRFMLWVYTVKPVKVKPVKVMTCESDR